MKPQLVDYDNLFNTELKVNENKPLIKKNKINKSKHNFFINIIAIIVIVLFMYFLKNRYLEKEKNKKDHIEKINDLKKITDI